MATSKGGRRQVTTRRPGDPSLTTQPERQVRHSETDRENEVRGARLLGPEQQATSQASAGRPCVCPWRSGPSSGGGPRPPRLDRCSGGSPCRRPLCSLTGAQPGPRLASHHCPGHHVPGRLGASPEHPWGHPGQLSLQPPCKVGQRNLSGLDAGHDVPGRALTPRGRLGCPLTGAGGHCRHPPCPWGR